MFPRRVTALVSVLLGRSKSILLESLALISRVYNLNNPLAQFLLPR